ncbi:MAG: fumarylacetoacetate hydrolase family protein [Thermoguttaceae bacterium]
MRLISYIDPARGIRAAWKRGDVYFDIADTDSSLPSDMAAFLSFGAMGRERLERATQLPPPLEPATLIYAPVVPAPDKIICVGLNYADHARETGKPVPAEPVIFSKFRSALLRHRGEIVLPRVSSRVDYEAELVVVIGKRGRDISEERALEFVYGYTCGNDVSARDWQFGKPAGQWLLGKTFDTFAPVGPEIVTADEVGDVNNLRVSLTVNGATMQDSTTAQFLFNVPQVIAYVSRVVTLEVGDLIFTGTPPGVGDARTPQVYLQHGDKVCVTIERVGTLENHCRKSE